MEIVPPAFTGDENAARCDESAFRIGFSMLNAAAAYDRPGFQNWFPVRRAFTRHSPISPAAADRPRPDETPARPPKHRQ
mgnify:CR=1 FL=1